jgi:uncharacterized membrane protein
MRGLFVGTLVASDNFLTSVAGKLICFSVMFLSEWFGEELCVLLFFVMTRFVVIDDVLSCILKRTTFTGIQNVLLLMHWMMV